MGIAHEALVNILSLVSYVEGGDVADRLREQCLLYRRGTVDDLFATKSCT